MGQVRSQKAKQFGIGNNLDKNAGFRMEKWRASFRVAVTMDPCGICDNCDRKNRVTVFAGAQLEGNLHAKSAVGLGSAN